MLVILDFPRLFVAVIIIDIMAVVAVACRVCVCVSVFAVYFSSPFDLLYCLYMHTQAAKYTEYSSMRTPLNKEKHLEKAISDNKAFQFMIHSPFFNPPISLYNRIFLYISPSNHLYMTVEDVIMYVYWIILSTVIKDFICIFMETNKDSLTACIYVLTSCHINVVSWKYFVRYFSTDLFAF